MSAAVDWDLGGRKPDTLWAGDQLQDGFVIKDNLASRMFEVADIAEVFLADSEKEEARKNRREKKMKWSRRFCYVLIFLTAFVLVLQSQKSNVSAQLSLEVAEESKERTDDS